MNKNLLIIGFVWPEPNSSAAGTRMIQLIKVFKSRNYEITFASAAAKSEHAINLKSLDVSVEEIKLNHESFDGFIKALQPDIVLFDRFMIEEQFGWRVAEHCPNALRILDTEDLHSLRKTRQEAHKTHDAFSIEKWLCADITKREIASIYRSDLSLIISEYELHLLRDTLNINSELLHYLPFMLDEISEEKIESLPAFKERQHFITIGNFRHDPNYDSILYLKEIIWPLIKKQMPVAELHIYGAYPMQKVTDLNNVNDGFYIKGWAKNAATVLQNARVCLAPLRFGAGLKGKFVEAMQVGTPSVTTTIGAEGLSEYFGGFIENKPQKIADKAIELYNNEVSWRLKQNNGFSLIKQFNKPELQKELVNKIELLIQQLKEKRMNNFIGAMLHHQSMQGSKYMSKWIEEKNEKG